MYVCFFLTLFQSFIYFLSLQIICIHDQLVSHPSSFSSSSSFRSCNGFSLLSSAFSSSSVVSIILSFNSLLLLLSELCLLLSEMCTDGVIELVEIVTGVKGMEGEATDSNNGDCTVLVVWTGVVGVLVVAVLEVFGVLVGLVVEEVNLDFGLELIFFFGLGDVKVGEGRSGAGGLGITDEERDSALLLLLLLLSIGVEGGVRGVRGVREEESSVLVGIAVSCDALIIKGEEGGEGGQYIIRRNQRER
mmetsp:Transcript_30122/g.30609  ORF Transcript_30122/g.30609 Transcript_30122/m.30609 type:complete len:247 (+) Transcript_30122:152-892(+)